MIMMIKFVFKTYVGGGGIVILFLKNGEEFRIKFRGFLPFFGILVKRCKYSVRFGTANENNFVRFLERIFFHTNLFQSEIPPLQLFWDCSVHVSGGHITA